MRSLLLAGALTASLAAASAAFDAIPRLVNARTETRSAAGGLEAAFRSAVKEARGPEWIGYAVPSSGRHEMCCGNTVDDVGQGCPGCRLEGKGALTVRGEATPVDGIASLEGDASVLVLFRADEGGVGRIRTFSPTCSLDAGGLRFVWLTGVRPAESVRLLRSLVDSASPDDSRDHRLREPALAAIAFHAEPSALEALIDLARHDASSHVRGQALFWLSQRAGDRVAGVITRAIDEDPETDVKKKAVFALSQLPHDQGVPLLIDTARRNRNLAVRKQAMFWLGQSNDPRALAFFEEVLKP